MAFGFEGGEKDADEDAAAMTPLNQSGSALAALADWGTPEDWSDWRYVAD